MKTKFAAGVIAACAAAAPVQAAETVTYTYDALGRLVTTTTSGGPNAGISTGTTFDPAGNRTTYTVTGASAALQAIPLVGDRRLARVEAGSERRAETKGPTASAAGGF
jgi:hypothetical protein